MSIEQEWRSSLKVGDKVIIGSGSIYYTPDTVGRVSRVTPTQVVAAGYRFMRDTGCMIGSANSYNPTRILMPTPERLEKIERNQMLKRIKDIPALTPTETLRTIVALLDKDREAK